VPGQTDCLVLRCFWLCDMIRITRVTVSITRLFFIYFVREMTVVVQIIARVPNKVFFSFAKKYR
jgi:hypothetical protein